MLVTYLAILYILLLLIERIFAIYNKEYTVGVITLSLILAVCCFIKSYYIAGSIWSLLTLLEYNHYINYFSDYDDR